MRKPNVAILTILLFFAFTACQRADQLPIQIEDPWGRPSPSEASLGAIYMKVTNNGSQTDSLLSASSSVCGFIELHETIMEGDVMKMRPVGTSGVTLPAGETVEFKPGGFHLMCIDKQQEFAIGDEIPLTLQFDRAGELELQVIIRNP